MWGGAQAAAAGSLLGLELSAVESDVDIFQRVGSPSYPAQVFVTVRDTAVITTINTGPFLAGSRVYLTVAGYFLAVGGRGGAGGWPADPGGGGDPPSPAVSAGDGIAGGNSLTMQCETLINLDAGRIWAGGGGGGGGGSLISFTAGGGGGGGVSGGAGGNPGGSAATTGIGAVPGTGGTQQGDGGAGGDWGQAGSPGESVGAADGQVGGAGGNAGIAIVKNGFTLTFLGKTEAQLRAEDRIKGVIL